MHCVSYLLLAQRTCPPFLTMTNNLLFAVGECFPLASSTMKSDKVGGSYDKQIKFGSNSGHTKLDVFDRSKRKPIYWPLLAFAIILVYSKSIMLLSYSLEGGVLRKTSVTSS